VSLLARQNGGLAEAAQVAASLAALSRLALRHIPDLDLVGNPEVPVPVGDAGGSAAGEDAAARREDQLHLRMLMGKVEVTCRTAEVRLGVLPGIHMVASAIAY